MAGLAPGPELIPQWLHKHSLKWSKEQITLYREIYGNGIISTSIKIYFGSLLALCRLFILTPLQKGKRSIAQGAYINFRGGAVFAVVFVASSQAAAARGETDQLKCRTPIVNNYFSMTLLKRGLSFTCISPESLNKKTQTSSPIVEHLKYIDPVLKWWCDLALNGQVTWPWGDEEMSRIRKSLSCSRFCVFCFSWKRSLLLEGLFNQINKPTYFSPWEFLL